MLIARKKADRATIGRWSLTVLKIVRGSFSAAAGVQVIRLPIQS